MMQYTLPAGDYTLQKRIRKELALFLYLQIILLVFFGINITLEASLLLMYFLMMTLKRNRIIYLFSFNDEKQSLEIRYFHLIFRDLKKTIPYSQLKGRIAFKRFGLGNQVKTLECLQDKELVGEIRIDGNWSWSEETFNKITEKINQEGTL